MCLRPGVKASDFEIPAYFPDGQIGNIKLSDYKGKWLVIMVLSCGFHFCLTY